MVMFLHLFVILFTWGGGYQSRGSLSRRPLPGTVEERAVRILLECILVMCVFLPFCSLRDDKIAKIEKASKKQGHKNPKINSWRKFQRRLS